jgi:hypothetical protein
MSRGMVGHAPVPPPAERQVRRPLLLAAVLVLLALVSIDCLNLTQSDTWSDLSQAPHMAAVSRTRETGGRTTAASLHVDRAAVTTEAHRPLPLVAVGAPAGDHTAPGAGGARRRERERAPPAPPLPPGTV